MYFSLQISVSAYPLSSDWLVQFRGNSLTRSGLKLRLPGVGVVDRPKDWTSPVDYRTGTVHIRAEVIEKPAGGAPTTWTLCYIPNKGMKAGYGCAGTGVYKEKGVYESDVKKTSF